MTEPTLVYMTASSDEEALRIGRALVGERLAACVNVIPGMRSIYWWDGRIQDDQETVLIAKTRTDLIAALTERVKALHSYAVPCVVALPITAGNKAYLDWLTGETAKC
ncbi:MAG: divalent-cation tolerance protein CutA [Alphaproteobacteria bacterium]